MTYDIWSIVLQSDQIVSNSAIGEELFVKPQHLKIMYTFTWKSNMSFSIIQLLKEFDAK